MLSVKWLPCVPETLEIVICNHMYSGLPADHQIRNRNNSFDFAARFA
jgi:hypothetical protein